MAAAAAAGVHADVCAAIELMSPAQAQLAPDPFWRRAHDAAYAIYLKLAEARDAAARDADGLAGMVRRAAR